VSHPDPGALADLALGDPVPDEVSSHVADCPACRDEVAALSAARDAVRAPLPELVPPPVGLREAVLAAALGTGAGQPVDAPGSRSADEPASEPVGRPVPAPATDELAARRLSLAARGRGRRFGAAWLVGAAAAGLVVGGAGVAALERDRSAEPEATVVARASLDTLDTGKPVGSADLFERGSVTDLAVHTTPMSPDGGYLEVWLINRDLKRMVSIGVLEPGSSDQTFAVPPELVAQGYVIVDISREPFDEDARHSGDSLMRGTLPV
jgi:anti-sigma factor RsiW